MAEQTKGPAETGPRLSREEAEKRADTFRQATAATLRAMGGQRAADVSFHSANMPLAPLRLGGKIRLQTPTLPLTE